MCLRSNKLTIAIILFISIILLSGFSKSNAIAGTVIKPKPANGVYDGSYIQLPDKAVVKVTIKDNKIVNIQLISHLDRIGKKAELPIIKEIIKKQSTKVDAVTGATHSSKAIMKAVQKAIDKAYIRKN